MHQTLALIVIYLFSITLASAEIYTLSGVVTDRIDGDPLSFANVSIDRRVFTTDADGDFTIRMPQGEYTISVNYVGYKTYERHLNLDRDMRLDIKLDKSDRLLQEVVITARESSGLTTASRIDRTAMQHLQPSSFTDLLELIPGNVSQDPKMGEANSITLRETGTVSATGVKTGINDDYAITSLGTSFVVDGVPINVDATMQGVPDASTGSAEGLRNTANKGVDMRTISTDNIESVDIVRGIPSAEYGNLTSGVVNIKRIRRATPLSARFKADGYSKLFSAGKGFGIRDHDHIVNVDISWLDSKVDPRDALEAYKRLTASARVSFRWSPTWGALVWSIGTDYTGSYDDVKIDPDLNFNKIDIFKSKYSRYAFTSELIADISHDWIFNAFAINSSVSVVDETTERTKQVAPQRASVAPTSMSEGVHDGVYLLREYIAEFRSESQPLAAFLKLKMSGSRSIKSWLNQYKAGLEWSMAKNLGTGQVYDLTRPLSASWTTRPRAFSDIPALHTLSFFIEDAASVSIGANQLQMQLGVRGISLPSLDSKYDMAGSVYMDPRANIQWAFPSFTLAEHIANMQLAVGYGLTTRMPTVDYLYPQLHYADMIELNYYDVINPDAHSRILLHTYIEDATNYQLKPARNRKLEARFTFQLGGNRLSMTYFNERMRDGFRYSSDYTPRQYRRYDATAIDASQLSAPPMLEWMPYEDRQVLDGMRRVTNGSRIYKQGVEFQLNTARLQSLYTALIISGAWLRSRYSNSQRLYYPVSDVVGDRAVSDFYVGIYDSDDGRINEHLNTNFMFDTQITRWNLTFTSTIQCMWYLKSRRLYESGIPTQYIANDGQIYDYTDESQRDVMLQYLVRHISEDAFRTVTVPIGIYFNLKATKQIGRWLRMSAFVNRIFDYLPDYRSNGITIRRSSDAYFGMEATITI